MANPTGTTASHIRSSTATKALTALAKKHLGKGGIHRMAVTEGQPGELFVDVLHRLGLNRAASNSMERKIRKAFPFTPHAKKRLHIKLRPHGLGDDGFGDGGGGGGTVTMPDGSTVDFPTSGTFSIVCIKLSTGKCNCVVTWNAFSGGEGNAGSVAASGPCD